MQGRVRRKSMRSCVFKEATLAVPDGSRKRQPLTAAVQAARLVQQQPAIVYWRMA
jgi:hypothetical protein